MGQRASSRKLLTRVQKFRAYALLDMLYKPSEIADELGMPKHLVYENLIPAGMPSSKDKDGFIWLHGHSVADWARKLGRSRQKLLAYQAYCLHCKKPVRMKGKRTVVSNGHMSMVKSGCVKCGGVVYRGVKAK